VSGIQVASSLVVIAALISYINERFLKMPGIIGHFLLGLSFSIFIILCEYLQLLPFHTAIRTLIDSVNFREILIGGMLSVLLFAGGLHTPLHLLKENKRTIFGLAFLTTALNTFIVGSIMWLLLGCLGFGITYAQALVFGALISPTDPLTAMAVLTRIGLPKRLETLFLGESLFNDGIGLVLFTVFSGLAFGQHDVTLGSGFELFLIEVGGGILMGLVLAGCMHYLVITSKDLYTHTLITIATVTGGYALSLALDISGPIAMVVLGSVAGNYTFETSITRSERHDTHVFWTLIDDILNAGLFILIGLQLMRVSFSAESLTAGAIAICVVFVGRSVSVLGALNALFIAKSCSRSQFGIVGLLTWGGLRGGLSIAMAFSLPQEEMVKPLILDMTFFVVAFSIIVQGLTISRFYSSQKLEKLAKELQSWE